MSGTMLAEGVYWVGVVDWSLRLFHGHELSTHRGSSYNAYLIVDEKTALVDTVYNSMKKERAREAYPSAGPGPVRSPRTGTQPDLSV